jgi:hypothetical protein
MFTKPSSADCLILCQNCAKTHVRAFKVKKIFPGATPPDPQGTSGGREGEGEGGEGRGQNRQFPHLFRQQTTPVRTQLNATRLLEATALESLW